MMEEVAENSTSCYEHRVLAAIHKIKGNKQRACYQNILAFFNRTEPTIEIDNLTQLLCEMESKDLVKNRSRSGKESFDFVKSETIEGKGSDSIQNGDAEDDHSLESLTSYIDDKFYDVLTNRIKDEVKTAVNIELKDLVKASIANELKVVKIKDTTNDVLCNELSDEISFLKRELGTKDAIIKMLIEERN